MRDTSDVVYEQMRGCDGCDHYAILNGAQLCRLHQIGSDGCEITKRDEEIGRLRTLLYAFVRSVTTQRISYVDIADDMMDRAGTSESEADRIVAGYAAAACEKPRRKIIAGEKIDEGDPVYLGADGKAYKSD